MSAGPYVEVRHNFETAHRLPQLGGKCASLHGHSWWVTIAVGAAGGLADSGIVIDFGTLKAGIRRWIDTHLDHGTMLAATDPLTGVLRAHGCKVFAFGADTIEGPERHAKHLPYPTVELVAVLLAGVTGWLLHEWLDTRPADIPRGLHVARVELSETAANAAVWLP